MDTLLEAVGLTSAEFTRLIILSAILLVGLFLARIALRMTMALFRFGCMAIVLIVAAVYVLTLLS